VSFPGTGGAREHDAREPLGADLLERRLAAAEAIAGGVDLEIDRIVKWADAVGQVEGRGALLGRGSRAPLPGGAGDRQRRGGERRERAPPRASDQRPSTGRLMSLSNAA
jgi:hypothetical protein